MKMTLPTNFDKLSAERKEEVVRCWVVANRDNLSIKVNCSTNKVGAYDKNTKEKVADFRLHEQDIEHFRILEDEVEVQDFDMRFTVKPNEIAYAILPEFIAVEEDGTYRMDFSGADKIKKVVVTKISGTSDIYDNHNTVSYKVIYGEDEDDTERETGTIVQEAVFKNYEDAKAVSELIDSPLVTWDEYMEYALDYITYRYKIKLPVKYGEIAYVTGNRKVKLESELTEDDKKGFLGKVRFSRAILSNLDETVDVQVTGLLYNMHKGKFVTLNDNEEVMVSLDTRYGYEFPNINTTLRGDEVHSMCLSYKYIDKSKFSIEPIEEDEEVITV